MLESKCVYRELHNKENDGEVEDETESSDEDDDDELYWLF